MGKTQQSSLIMYLHEKSTQKNRTLVQSAKTDSPKKIVILNYKKSRPTLDNTVLNSNCTKS